MDILQHGKKIYFHLISDSLDSMKIEKKLGWKPKIPLELGIKNTLNYFNTQKL